MESEYIETNGYEEIIDYNAYDDEDYNPNNEEEFIEKSDDSEDNVPAPPPKKRKTKAVDQPKRHKQNENSRTKENCPYCGVGYNLGYLQRHVLIHKTEKNPVCKLCQTSVKGLDLWEHYCNSHPEIANQCGKLRQQKKLKPFGSSSEAVRKSINSTETSFGNEFSRFIGIENSPGGRTVQEFKCEICLNALFHMKSDLNNHMSYCHSNYSPANAISKFICTICGNSYGNQFYLQEHMESHVVKESKLAVESLLKLDSLDDEEYLIQ